MDTKNTESKRQTYVLIVGRDISYFGTQEQMLMLFRSMANYYPVVVRQAYPGEIANLFSECSQKVGE
jgi:hypothetical protein